MTTKIDKMGESHAEDEGQTVTVAGSSSVIIAGSDDILALGRVDQALSTKMQLVNEVSLKRYSVVRFYIDNPGN